MGVHKKGGLVGGFDQLRAPDAPTISVAKASTSSVTVTFTNPSDVGGGAITSYTATAIASGVPIGATSASSPVTITGLTNGTSYSVTGLANNAFGASPYSGASSITVAPPVTQQIGLFFGGSAGSGGQNYIDQRNLASTGNASDFGDMAEGKSAASALGNTTRGIVGGGTGAGGSALDVIQYVTFASAGNTTDFGDLSVGKQTPAPASNHTRGIFAGGETTGAGGGSVNVIEYITIASTGDVTDFGDLLSATSYSTGSLCSPTRSVFAGGYTGSSLINVIQYITTASTGDATDFGDTASGTWYHGSGVSNSTRGIIGVGAIDGTRTNAMEYITIASTGNTTDFGDLTVTREHGAAASGSTYGVFAGGLYTSYQNVMDYVTIASTGNATDFGDLVNARGYMANGGCSSSHGGLQ